jgi:hypothetical protein
LYLSPSPCVFVCFFLLPFRPSLPSCPSRVFA